MNGPIISVVIPVYNAEKYLKRSVESILNQTEKNLELILVDDGSTDGSAQICDAYAAADARVRVIHKQNEGSSMARNDGIQAANGCFVAFVDADDWLEPDMYSRLLDEQRRTGSELVYCGFLREYADKVVQDTAFTEARTYTGAQVREFTKDLFDGKIFGALWRALYAKDSIGTVRLDREIRYAEDLLFQLELLKHVTSVSVIPDAYYHYDQTNENSVTNMSQKDPDFRYTACLQKQLEINQFWNFTLDPNEFYKVYVDMMFQYLVRKLQEGNNEALVRKYLTEGFFSTCCMYDAYIPARRKIVCRLIRRGWFRTAVMVRKMQDCVLKIMGRPVV